MNVLQALPAYFCVRRIKIKSKATVRSFVLRLIQFIEMTKQVITLFYHMNINEEKHQNEPIKTNIMTFKMDDVISTDNMIRNNLINQTGIKRCHVTVMLFTKCYVS